MVSRSAIFLTLFWMWGMMIVSSRAWAQEAVRSQPPIPSAFHGAASTCEHNSVESYLDVNNVRARVLNSGRLFWKNGGLPIYEVPKNSGKSSIFTAALWMSGEVDNEFRAATGTYWQSEFWPGLLDDAGNPPADCTPYNRLYNVSRRDLVLYDSLGITTADLAEWPIHLGAPVIDGDGDPDNYNLATGDRPDLLGDQSIFWVMNDAAGEHWRSNTLPLGVDIIATAGAYRSENEALNHTTFYRYRIRYRGEAPLEQARIGLFADAQLGGWLDDFVGADTSSLKMVYSYNADNVDDDGGGYGEAPPALGYSFIDGVEHGEDELRLSTFIYNDEVHEGFTGEVMQRHFEGRLVFSGDADYILDGCTPGEGCVEGATKDTTNIMVPGDPVTAQYWSETNWWDGNPYYGGSRTILFTMGPFTMEPGEEQEVVLAIVWARGDDHLDSVTQLKSAMGDVQAGWEAQSYLSTLEDVPVSVPTMLSPANGAMDQASTVELAWEETDVEHAYWVEWGKDPSLEHATGQLVAGALHPEGYNEAIDRMRHTLPDLALGETYYWRTRAVSTGGVGPPSPIRSFTVGQALLRAGGPRLLKDGTHAILEMAGPGGSDPCATSALDLGCSELGGNQVWQDLSSAEDFKVISFDLNPNWYPFSGFAPNDYEIRFTEAGSLALFSSFGNVTVAKVPFELWDIGPTEPSTPNDASDDVQLLPRIFPSNEGACTFRYEVNTSYTDWLATQRFTGEYVEGEGYAVWADSMTAVYEAYNGLCMPLLEAHRPSYERSSLFSSLRFTGNPDGPNYREEGPPAGTIVRFFTTSHGLSTPRPASPAEGAANVVPGSYFWWNSVPDVRTHIQVARDPGFTTIAAQDTVVNAQRWAVPQLIPGGVYYWRVRSAFTRGRFTEWSPAWSFTLSTIVEAESEELPHPQQLELAGNFPNPFRHQTRLRMGLAASEHVRVEVHDLLGRRIAVLVDEVKNAGWHEVHWRPDYLSSGVYFVVAQTSNARRLMKVVYLR